MIAGIPPLSLFGVTLTVESVDREGSFVTARCEVEDHHLRAAARVLINAALAESLLQQVERQYTDFGQRVTWSSVEDFGQLDLTWTMNTNGHAQGQFTLQNNPHWRVEGELDGDQSYLPKVALGLRLMLRAMKGETL